MTKYIITIMSLYCFLSISGCSTVVSKYPIGTENYNASPDSWNGTWLSDDEFIRIKVIDPSNGILKVAWIEEKENDLKLESFTCQIKKGEKGLYLNVRDMPNEDFEGFYLWGKVKKENQKILFWLPSIRGFNKAYEAKKLKAIIEKTKPDKSGNQNVERIKLLEDSNSILDIIENNSGEYFDLENPIILIKIVK